MKCNNCGANISETDKFCPECGKGVSMVVTENKVSVGNITGEKVYSRKLLGFRSNVTWKKVLSVLYLISVAFMALGFIVGNEGFKDVLAGLVTTLMSLSPYLLSDFPIRDKLPLFKKHTTGSTLLGLFIIWFVGIILVGIINPSDYSSDNIEAETTLESTTVTTTSTKSTTAKTKVKAFKSIEDETLKSNMINACLAIGADTTEIKNFKQLANWSGGTCYQFMYKSNDVIVYVNEDNTINSMNMHSNNVKVYEQGFEPLNIEDYVLDTSFIPYIQIAAEDAIKKNANYPSTVDFHWITTGGYARFGDVLCVSGEFDAQNAFGVESSHKFYIEEKYTETDSKLHIDVVLITIDGQRYLGEKSSIPELEKKEIVTKASASGGVVLKYGAKGNYGKIDKYDGEDYIRYYVPAGKYKVTALASNSNFYIESQSIHKEDGADVSDTIRTVYLKTKGDTDTIEIKSNQCISLMINANIELTPIK